MRKMDVGNIPYNTTEEDLRGLFSEYGEIDSLKIIQDRDTGRSKGFGFIEMAEEKFESYLDQLDPHHPPLTDQNRPEFLVGDLMDLDYEDNSFDASYTMLVMHWVPDPKRAIREIVRVVKPGGLIFGAQPIKPYINPYVDLIIRSSRNSNGFFWKEDFIQWFREYGLETEIVSPAGIFRVTNSQEASDIALQKEQLDGTN